MLKRKMASLITLRLGTSNWHDLITLTQVIDSRMVFKAVTLFKKNHPYALQKLSQHVSTF